jgi:glycosyltransferase involved in cell wall biosynthesis
MRYAWEMYYTYFPKNSLNPVVRWTVPFFMNYLRTWDENSAGRVDHFVANSQNVKRRIQKHYRRDAEVIYPPVDTEYFGMSKNQGEYFLVVSALVPYKRIDLAVLAFNELNLPLLLVGEGAEKKKLMKMAKKNIKFIDWQSGPELIGYYQQCRALIFPGEEDFGIVPVEAQACGKPVIAFGKGGATESVKGAYPDQDVTSSHSGIFFHPQTAQALIQAVRRFESARFDPEQIREHALRFDKEVFRRSIKEFIEKRFHEHQESVR